MCASYSSITLDSVATRQLDVLPPPLSLSLCISFPTSYFANHIKLLEVALGSAGLRWRPGVSRVGARVVQAVVVMVMLELFPLDRQGRERGLRKSG